MTVIRWQRLEGGAIALAAAAAGPLAFGFAWWWPVALFLAFDLSALGYAAGPRVGAALYNAGHSYAGAVVCAAVFALTGADAWAIVALAWAVHIGLDRALGYGLKHPDAFQHTHLGWIGRAAPGEGELRAR
ncbi:DUF4260 domain-containing protein [Demequina soli]|uniref:DUF4260 domain-containing protein n=1 Tax=Demequina soli TaxID=1638987 RepID=UPI0007817B13|nr:DUF4260 domain-containing protein [Demequina soli]